MRTRLAVAVVVLALAGCSGGTDPVAAPTASSSQETASASPSEEVAAPVPSPSGGEVEAASGPPEQCAAASTAETEGDPIVAAAHAAELPEGVVLRPGVQVIGSTEVEGEWEAVARICSRPLSGDEHREVATSIAQAIYASDAGDSLASLRVTSWVPDGDTITEAESLRIDDYGIVLWDSETANLDAMWKTRDEA